MTIQNIMRIIMNRLNFIKDVRKPLCGGGRM